MRNISIRIMRRIFLTPRYRFLTSHFSSLFLKGRNGIFGSFLCFSHTKNIGIKLCKKIIHMFVCKEGDLKKEEAVSAY